MALHGSGGAYYRSNATIPNTVGMHSAYTRHFWVRGAVAPAIGTWKIPASMIGTGQNPGDQFRWNGGTGAYYKSNGHRQASGAYIEAQYASALPANTWLGLGVTFDGAYTRSYLDGILDATSVATSAASGNSVFIDLLAALTYAGALDASSNWTDGEVAEHAYWNVALTADEMTSLGKGFRPDRIRPQSLQFYSPCVRGLQDIRGGRTLVKQAGSDVVSDHPRVF